MEKANFFLFFFFISAENIEFMLILSLEVFLAVNPEKCQRIRGSNVLQNNQTLSWNFNTAKTAVSTERFALLIAELCK